MARANQPVITNLNGGEIGDEVIARTNIETYNSSASILENFLPSPAGPIDFRPGLKFCTELTGVTRGIEFVYDTATYGLLLSDEELRIEQAGGVIVRTAVTAAITNGSLVAGLAGWTDISAGAGTATGGTDGLTLASNGTDIAGVRQTVAITETGTVHGLRIIVERGPVTLLLGSTAGGDEYLRTELRTGEHSIGVAPSGNLSIAFTSTAEADRIVTSIALEAAGDLVLPTPWAAADLRKLRHDSDKDVMWITSGIGKIKRIERRSSSSWSIVDTSERDGPFQSPNVDESYTITPSVRSGNGTLTASRALFAATHVGSLWMLTHSGQYETRAIAAANTFTDYIKVQGVGASRTVVIDITGVFTATVTLQRSVGNTTSWTDVSTYTAATSFSYLDGTTFDNQTVYYEIGVKTGDYTSGTATCTMTYGGGATDGVARVTGYTSSTVVDMEVLDAFANTTATNEWAEGSWSDRQTWPKGVALYDGRLWTGGYFDRFWGSKSDDYESHATGDSADDAIARNVAIGGQSRRILALLGLARLIMLSSIEAADVEPVKVEGGATIVKSSAFDEPLTPTNLTVRDSMASRGIFIDRDGHQAMEIFYSVESQDYEARTLMRLHRNLGRPSIVEIATSRRPDRRLWFGRSDGQLLCKLYDVPEAALGWARIITDGEIESIYVKPASGEDEVMVIVKRTIEGVDRRYLEQFDPMYLATASDANRVDSYVRKTGTFSTIDGLDHLEGEVVKIMINGAAHPDKTVSGGVVTLDYTVTDGVGSAGLGYTGRYQSAKLAMAARAGTPLGQLGRAVTISFLLHNSSRAIEFGADFDTMDWMHDRGFDASYDAGPGLWTGTTEAVTMPGDPNRDPRVCLRVQSPNPATIQGYIIGGELQEKVT